MTRKGAHRNTAKRSEERYCDDCDSSTHNKKDCWGPCTHCGRRGNRSSECNKNKREEKEKEKEKGEQAKAKKAQENKKKREKKKAKKKAERALEEAAKKEEASNSDSTASEEDSPVQARKARLERVGLSGSARRAISFQNQLLDMSVEESTKLATSITTAVSIDDTAPQAPRRSERQRQSRELSAQQSP